MVVHQESERGGVVWGGSWGGVVGGEWRTQEGRGGKYEYEHGEQIADGSSDGQDDCGVQCVGLVGRHPHKRIHSAQILNPHPQCATSCRCA